MLHTFHRVRVQNEIGGQLSGRIPGKILENPVEMPDGIESALGSDSSDRKLPVVMVQKKNSFFQTDDIKILGKGHAGYIFEKPGKIRFRKTHKMAGILKGHVAVLFFDLL